LLCFAWFILRVASLLAGLTASCTFVVSVVDQELPTVTCPDSQTYSINEPATSTLTAFTVEPATDNVKVASTRLLRNGAAITEIDPEFFLGRTVLSLSAIDSSGLLRLERLCALTDGLWCLQAMLARAHGLSLCSMPVLHLTWLRPRFDSSCCFHWIAYVTILSLLVE
jgi:hypothetical protein